jgi:hypothetical protein
VQPVTYNNSERVVSRARVFLQTFYKIYDSLRLFDDIYAAEDYFARDLARGHEHSEVAKEKS